MRHLALPFFCVVFLGIALCEAFASGISTRFGAAFMVAAIVWVVLAYIEIRAAWFAEAVQRRRSERHRTPLPSDDTH